jgi:hypothetical protein
LRKRAKKRGGGGKQPRNGQAEKRAAAEWSVPLMLDRDELVAMLQECLTDFATQVGLEVACLLFQKQVDIGCKRTTSGERGNGHKRQLVYSPKRQKSSRRP